MKANTKSDEVEFRNFVYGSTKKKCGGISLPFRSIVSSSSSSSLSSSSSSSSPDDPTVPAVAPLPVKQVVDENTNKMEMLDSFLENDKKRNLQDNWSRLDRSTKTTKIAAFVSLYAQKKQLSPDNESKLSCFLRDCLINKRLQRIKDVSYDKAEGILHDIPGLYFNEDHQQFYLKHNIPAAKSSASKEYVYGGIVSKE